MDEDVYVYGTNPAISPLLRSNPFSFPQGVHVLEHLDRLVEIFNVCWPMYTAMPAVLKNAIEKSYVDCGWNLMYLTNRYGENIYPTFADVARNIKEIIDTSEYDSENKGAYKGSLLTRLQSLTNGINGMIFSCNDLADKELVGRAANLNDDQIVELAKLPCGVAAIYQNEWVQPVLCKVHKFEVTQELYSYTPGTEVQQLDFDGSIVTESLLDCIMNKELFRQGNGVDIVRLKNLLIRSKLDASIKRDFMEYISSGEEDAVESLRRLLYNFLAAEEAIKASVKCNEITSWVHSVVDGLNPSIKDYSKKQIDLAFALILHEQVLHDAAYNNLFVCLFC